MRPLAENDIAKFSLFKMAAPKKPELGLLEEDDEFEEFPVEGTAENLAHVTYGVFSDHCFSITVSVALDLKHVGPTLRFIQFAMFEATQFQSVAKNCIPVVLFS